MIYMWRNRENNVMFMMIDNNNAPLACILSVLI